MSETALSILLFLHLAFVAVWLGSQVLVAAAVVPSVRRLEQGEARLAVLETFTNRFNVVALVSMIVIVVTGGIMVSERLDEVEAIFGDSIFDSRWGVIFVIKMTLWVLMMAAVAGHAYWVGPRQLAIMREGLAHDAEWARAHVRPLQLRSMALSISGLTLTLLVLGSGAFLGNHGYSYQFA